MPALLAIVFLAVGMYAGMIDHPHWMLLIILGNIWVGIWYLQGLLNQLFSVRIK